MFDPVRPLFLLPEVTDESKWLGGFEHMYADKEKQYLPTYFISVNSGVRINRDVIPESELNSHKQLLDPRWKGKIAINDPWGGSGLGTLTVFLAAYGEEFVRELLTAQAPVVTGDSRKLEEWGIRDQYPIGIRAPKALQIELEREGTRINVREGGERISMPQGFGAVALVNRAPHPHAAQLYLNWLLTQKVQAKLTSALQENSRRVDGRPGEPEGVVDPARLKESVFHMSEELLMARTRAQQLAAELIRQVGSIPEMRTPGRLWLKII